MAEGLDLVTPFTAEEAPSMENFNRRIEEANRLAAQVKDETIDAAKAYIDSTCSGSGGPYYATCATAYNISAKVADCSGFQLETGATVNVKFTYYNSAASPTLNVNGTGAKSIKKYGTTGGMAYMWGSGEMVQFTYDGTNWVMTKGMTATTTYYGLTKLSSSVASTSTTLAATPSAVRQVNLTASEALTLAKDRTRSAQEVFLSAETAAAFGTVQMQNIILNGDFEDSPNADGSAVWWDYDSSEIQLDVNALGQRISFNPSGSRVYLRQQIGGINKDHKYYFRMAASCSDASALPMISIEMGQAYFEQTFELSNTQDTDISIICTGSTDAETISIGVMSSDVTYIDNIMLVDLTAAFGSGKEPAVEECDQNIVSYDTAYIYKLSVDEALRKIAQALNLGGDT